MAARADYRRFFSITSLAGLRQEDRAVFDQPRRGQLAGSPKDSSAACASTSTDYPISGYLARLLRGHLGERWIVVRKILAVDEALEAALRWLLHRL